MSKQNGKKPNKQNTKKKSSWDTRRIVVSVVACLLCVLMLASLVVQFI